MKPVTVDIEVTDAASDPVGVRRISLKGRAVVNRKDWGVKWDAALDALLVGARVTVEFEVIAIRTARDS